jgi:hypothetical protein
MDSNASVRGGDVHGALGCGWCSNRTLLRGSPLVSAGLELWAKFQGFYALSGQAWAALLREPSCVLERTVEPRHASVSTCSRSSCMVVTANAITQAEYQAELRAP